MLKIGNMRKYRGRKGLYWTDGIKRIWCYRYKIKLINYGDAI